jgi:hypothetical protein
MFIIANILPHFALSHLPEFLSCAPCLLVFRMPSKGEDLFKVLGTMMPSCLPLGLRGVRDGCVGSGTFAPLGHIVADLLTSVLLTSSTSIA